MSRLRTTGDRFQESEPTQLVTQAHASPFSFNHQFHPFIPPSLPVIVETAVAPDVASVVESVVAPETAIVAPSSTSSPFNLIAPVMAHESCIGTTSAAVDVNTGGKGTATAVGAPASASFPTAVVEVKHHIRPSLQDDAKIPITKNTGEDGTPPSKPYDTVKKAAGSFPPSISTVKTPTTSPAWMQTNYNPITLMLKRRIARMAPEKRPFCKSRKQNGELVVYHAWHCREDSYGGVHYEGRKLVSCASTRDDEELAKIMGSLSVSTPERWKKGEGLGVRVEVQLSETGNERVAARRQRKRAGPYHSQRPKRSSLNHGIAGPAVNVGAKVPQGASNDIPCYFLECVDMFSLETTPVPSFTVHATSSATRLVTQSPAPVDEFVSRFSALSLQVDRN